MESGRLRVKCSTGAILASSIGSQRLEVKRKLPLVADGEQNHRAPNAIERSVVVTLTLMAQRQHRHGLGIVDFKQCDIAGCAKRDDQFTQKR